MTLRDAWEENAADWVRWAREPGHDSYWRFHRERFLALVPAPGRITLDVGCGEGRLSRDLKDHGHDVIGVDASETMIAAAREADPEGTYVVGDAASLPFPDGHAGQVVSFMSLMDVDDMPGAVREFARVLESGGRLAIAIVHPMNSAIHPMNSAHEYNHEGRHPADWLVLTESYFDRRVYRVEIERDGLRMVFESRHWTLEDYFDAILGAGFQVEALREIPDLDHARWSRFPLFLHLLAAKASQPG